jgi:hypothetical protein
LVSFSQLQKQIMDLATTHFVHLPVTPPPDVLEKIPPELPSFLGNTSASRYVTPLEAPECDCEYNSAWSGKGQLGDPICQNFLGGLCWFGY